MYTAIVSVLVALATVASARYTTITTGFGVCYVNPTTSTTVGGPAATTTIDLPLTTTTSVTYWVYPTNAVEEKRGAVTTIYVAGGCSSTDTIYIVSTSTTAVPGSTKSVTEYAATVTAAATSTIHFG